jgi:hypothetical protein
MSTRKTVGKLFRGAIGTIAVGAMAVSGVVAPLVPVVAYAKNKSQEEEATKKAAKANLGVVENSQTVYEGGIFDLPLQTPIKLATNSYITEATKEGIAGANTWTNIGDPDALEPLGIEADGTYVMRVKDGYQARVTYTNYEKSLGTLTAKSRTVIDLWTPHAAAKESGQESRAYHTIRIPGAEDEAYTTITVEGRVSEGTGVGNPITTNMPVFTFAGLAADKSIPITDDVILLNNQEINTKKFFTTAAVDAVASWNNGNISDTKNGNIAVLPFSDGEYTVSFDEDFIKKFGEGKTQDDLLADGYSISIVAYDLDLDEDGNIQFNDVDKQPKFKDTGSTLVQLDSTHNDDKVVFDQTKPQKIELIVKRGTTALDMTEAVYFDNGEEQQEADETKLHGTLHVSTWEEARQAAGIAGVPWKAVTDANEGIADQKLVWVELDDDQFTIGNDLKNILLFDGDVYKTTKDSYDKTTLPAPADFTDGKKVEISVKTKDLAVQELSSDDAAGVDKTVMQVLEKAADHMLLSGYTMTERTEPQPEPQPQPEDAREDFSIMGTITSVATPGGTQWFIEPSQTATMPVYPAEAASADKDNLGDFTPQDEEPEKILFWTEPENPSVADQALKAKLMLAKDSDKLLKVTKAILAAAPDGVTSYDAAFAHADAIDVVIDETPDKPSKKELEDELAKVDKLDKDEYTDASWSQLEAAVTAGEAVMADDEATEDQIKGAVDALKTARAALVPKQDSASKELLKEAIDAAGAYEADKDTYTEASYKALTDALADAKKVYADEAATQDEVDDALDKLSEAVIGLVKKDTPSPQPQPTTKSGIDETKASGSTLRQGEYAVFGTYISYDATLSTNGTAPGTVTYTLSDAAVENGFRFVDISVLAPESDLEGVEFHVAKDGKSMQVTVPESADGKPVEANISLGLHSVYATTSDGQNLDEWASDRFKDNTFFKKEASDDYVTDGYLKVTNRGFRETPIDFTLVFHDDSIPEDQRTKKFEDMVWNSAFSLPTPVKEGYKFVTWYADEALQFPFDPVSMPQDGVTLDLYPKWEEASPTPTPTPDPTVPTDKTSLKKKIDEAKGVDANPSTTKYTESSLRVLATALAEAEKVYADENATADQISAAYKALDEALKGLVAKGKTTTQETTKTLPAQVNTYTVPGTVTNVPTQQSTTPLSKTGGAEMLIVGMGAMAGGAFTIQRVQRRRRK